MTSKWETVRLSNLLLHIIGGAWGKPPGESDVDVIAFGTKAFVNGATLLNPGSGILRSISKAQYDKRQLFEGDIILEVSGGSPSQPVGRALYVDRDFPEVIPSSFMRLMRFDHSRIVPVFAFQLLQFLYQTGVTAACQTNTTGIRNLSVPDFLRTRIALPSLPEQRRIVDLIGALDDAIEAAESRRNLINDLYNELVTAAATGSCPKTPLGEILTQVKSQTVLEQSESYRVAGIERSGMGFIDRGEVLGSSISYPKLTQIKSGQLAYRKLTAWEGPISVADEDIDGAYLSPEFPVFEIDDSKYSRNLLRHLCTWPGFWEMMAARLTGSVLRRKRLNPNQLLEIEIPVPPPNEQLSIVEELDAAKEYSASAADHVVSLRKLRSELLTVLLSGAHEIPESYDSVMDPVSN